LYACAPYRGCGHGCRYCDGRAEKYYVEGDFERDVEVRANLPDLLAQELPGLRDRGMISFGSGVTDAYQPLETTKKITERCIPLLEDRGWPVLVITKSALVRRDAELWRRVDARGGIMLFMTVTGTDEEVRNRFEPGAATYRARLETLEAFGSAGMATGALAMPLLPFINDDDASIRSLFGALKETGVSFIMPGGLTLRPGRQKDLYLDEVSAFKPELMPGYERIYAENRLSGAPIKEAAAALRRRCADELKRIGLPWTLPHAVYSRFLPPHDAFRILLRDMAELYAERGVSVRRLISSADRYDEWLKKLRGEFRRRRSLPADWLKDRFLNAVELGELDAVLDNVKLASFAKDTMLNRYVFDYMTLKLRDS
jgi:DNA repair photolyase